MSRAASRDPAQLSLLSVSQIRVRKTTEKKLSLLIAIGEYTVEISRLSCVA